jgi:hypothetical protein
MQKIPTIKGRMKNFLLLSIVFLLTILFMNNVSALTNIDACQALSSAGETYVLNASIDDSASSICFSFTVNNITLDCAGFTINMSNIPSTVFSLGNFNNSIVENCIIYAQNSDDNTLVATGGVNNFTYQNNSAYVVGKSWAGDANDNVVSITGNYFNQSCYHEIINEPSLRITGQYINYDNNIFDGYCNNATYSGTNVFQEINFSTITNSIFNIAGSADEPLTFHGLHGNLIDNITINATNLWYANSGMVGRFCCGTDNIFRNSRMYLNWTFNIYAVNSKGDNITWDNIYMEATGNQLTMGIFDYDNVTIKNSVFKGITQEVYGNNVFSYPSNSTLSNFVLNNVTSDNSISFSNAIAGDSWNLTNSYYGKGVSLVNVSNAFLLKSSYLNRSSGNNFQLDSSSNSNIIYNNTFNVGNVVDSGTGNSYCVNGTGNTYTGGSTYSGSGLGTCPSPYINSCQTLSNANQTYILNASIANRVGTCFTINANGITLDCANFEIDGDGTGTDYGIYIYNSTLGVNDTTIKNCFIKEFYYGIYVRGATSKWNINTSLYNITSYNNVGAAPAGIYGTLVKNTVALNITVYNNTGTTAGYGIRLATANDTYIEDLVSRDNYKDSAILTYGISLLSNTNLTLVNAVSYNNFYGFSSSTTSYMSLQNVDSHDNSLDFYLLTARTEQDCDTITFSNVTSSGIPYFFTNETVNMDNWNNISGIALCDADNSTISNLVLENKSGILTTRSDNLVISNVSIRNNGQFYISASNNSIFDNISVIDTASLQSSLQICYNTSLENSNFEDTVSILQRALFSVSAGRYEIKNSRFYREFSYPLADYSMTFDATDGTAVNISNSYIFGNTTALSIPLRYSTDIWNIYNTTIERASNETKCGSYSYENYGGIYLYCYTCNNLGSVNLYNTTIADYCVNSSVLNVYWNLDVNNPLSANAKIYNLTGEEVASFSDSRDLWLLNYYVTRVNSRTNSTPHNINITKSGYNPNSSVLTMDTNREYIIYMTVSHIPVIDPDSITGRLVITTGLGIMGLFSILTLIYFGYTWKDPEMIVKVMIAITIIILMIVAVWQGLVL